MALLVTGAVYDDNLNGRGQQALKAKSSTSLLNKFNFDHVLVYVRSVSSICLDLARIDRISFAPKHS